MADDFSEASFERKLAELRESQKEIQAMSAYCIHHRCQSILLRFYAIFGFLLKPRIYLCSGCISE